MQANLSTLRIGFVWQTLTSENLGVAALAEANLSIVRTAALREGFSPSCIEFSSTGPNINLATERSCEIADRLSPKNILLGRSRYINQLKDCAAIIDIGEGDSFADIYGKKRFFFLSLTKFLAIFNRIPLILAPQTIGPFNSKTVARIASSLMRRAERVFARDHQSMAYLEALGITGNATEAIDVAFRLPYEPRQQPRDGKTHVGVNVSGLLYNGGYTKNNQFGLKGDYAKLIDKLLAALNNMPEVQVHLVGHVLSKTFAVEDDYRVCEKLHAAYPDSIVAPWFTSPSDAKSYISALHFFTGARMHACIGAFSSGVPVVPMAYSRKFNGLFGSLGYHHIADLKADDIDTALAKILGGLAQRATLAQEVAQGNAMATAKLQVYEDYLTEVFRSLHERKR